LGLNFTKVKYAHGAVEYPKEIKYQLVVKQFFVELSQYANTITPIPPLSSTIIANIITCLKNREIDEENKNRDL